MTAIATKKSPSKKSGVLKHLHFGKPKKNIGSTYEKEITKKELEDAVKHFPDAVFGKKKAAPAKKKAVPAKKKGKALTKGYYAPYVSTEGSVNDKEMIVLRSGQLKWTPTKGVKKKLSGKTAINSKAPALKKVKKLHLAHGHPERFGGNTNKQNLTLETAGANLKGHGSIEKRIASIAQNIFKTKKSSKIPVGTVFGKLYVEEKFKKGKAILRNYFVRITKKGKAEKFYKFVFKHKSAGKK